MVDALITRADAKAAGITRYYTGVPCKSGHLTRRNVRDRKCIECARLSTLAYREKHRERHREYERTFLKAWKRKQKEIIAGRPRPATCEVCDRECDPHFDHCHETGKFRGWLCAPCNRTLGQVNDRSDVLRKLAEYLDSHRSMVDA